MHPETFLELKEKIKKFAGTIGLDKIGFADARPLHMHLDRLRQRKNSSYSYAIKEGDPIKRINPELHLPNAKSVICTAVAYQCSDEEEPGGSRGRLSFISRGVDYHIIMREKLRKLEQFILQYLPEARMLAMVDKEEFLEKAFAVKAGLGWFGKNTLLVTPEFGSLVYLGELVTDIPFPPDKPLDSSCGNCNRCINACPTKALEVERNLNPDLCLAGVSQFKGILKPELMDAMGNTIYGCDICQLACPYNRLKRNKEAEKTEKMNVEECFPVLNVLLQMSNADFKNRFGHTAGAWRGRTVYQRNAATAAGNLKDKDSVPVLIKILAADSRPVMRNAAAWALGKINEQAGIDALYESLKREKDPLVLEEINRALENSNKIRGCRCNPLKN